MLSKKKFQLLTTITLLTLLVSCESSNDITRSYPEEYADLTGTWVNNFFNASNYMAPGYVHSKETYVIAEDQSHRLSHHLYEDETCQTLLHLFLTLLALI